MRILCAVDLSPQSKAAIRLAARVAARFGDTVQLLHVLAPPSVLSPEPVVADRPFPDPQERAAQERLSDLAASVARESGVQIETEVLLGHPALLIAEHARSINARMIVVGLGSRRALARWFLGSVAERTVRNADRPVLVAPSDDGTAASVAGPSVWTEKGRPLRVLVGLDRTHASDAALTYARGLRHLGACDVTFVHIYWPPDEFQRLGLLGRRELLDPDAEVVESLEREFRLRVGVLPGQGEVSFSVQPGWGSTATHLLLGAELGRFDLIVVATEHRRGLDRLWHGSVAEALVRATTVTPVICVPNLPEGVGPAKDLPTIVKVLAPTDLSPAGNQAIPHAYALLRATGGVVELCHVHEAYVSHPTYGYDSPKPTLTAARREEIASQLRALVPREAEAMGITTHVHVIDGGSADEAISQAAERLEVDAISMGSHGRTGVARVLMGSVAERVLRHAHRPVLVVRPDAMHGS
jgi:nucleotide-binding universal stress UspA family protein